MSCMSCPSGLSGSVRVSNQRAVRRAGAVSAVANLDHQCIALITSTLGRRLNIGHGQRCSMKDSKTVHTSFTRMISERIKVDSTAHMTCSSTSRNKPLKNPYINTRRNPHIEVTKKKKLPTMPLLIVNPA